MFRALELSKRRIVAYVAALTFGLGGINAAQAPSAVAADPFPFAVEYPVNMNDACGQQYPGRWARAYYWSITDPNSWFCFHVPGGTIFPPSLDFKVDGGINVQAWCDSAHPGTRAILKFPFNTLGWHCRA